MKLTTKGRYAVTAMLDLAIKYQDSASEPVTVANISERHNLSPMYLERLLNNLKNKGFLKSIRGAKGGYLLALEPHQINIADIIQASGESLDTTNCKGKSNCNGGAKCLTHNLWSALNLQIHQFLGQISLQNLLEQINNPVINPINNLKTEHNNG